MSYVMVPCPEEHLHEVTTALMRMTMGMAGWDDAAIARLVSMLDDRERSLLREVAEASIADGHLAYRELGETLGIEAGQLLHLVTALNDRCRRAAMPLPLITDSHAISGEGGEPTAIPVLIIVPPVARKILEHLDAAADPLDA